MTREVRSRPHTFRIPPSCITSPYLKPVANTHTQSFRTSFRLRTETIDTPPHSSANTDWAPGKGKGERFRLPLFLHLCVSRSVVPSLLFVTSLSVSFVWVSSSLSLFLIHCFSSILACVSFSSKFFPHPLPSLLAKYFPVSVSVGLSLVTHPHIQVEVFNKIKGRQGRRRPSPGLTPPAHTGREGEPWGSLEIVTPEVGRPGRGRRGLRELGPRRKGDCFSWIP